MSTTRVPRTADTDRQARERGAYSAATYLQIQGGSAPVQTLPLEGDTIKLGKGPQCQIQISDDSLGDLQCLFRFKDGAWQYEPIGPPGRVWIDGRAIEDPYTLPFGVPFRIGRHWVTLRTAENAFNDWLDENDDAADATDATMTADDRGASSRKSTEPRPSGAALSETEERLRKWQARLEQRERMLRDRQEERRWEARWKSAGESLRARSTDRQGPTSAPRQRPAAPSPAPVRPATNATPASVPTPAPTPPNAYRPQQSPPVSRIIETRQPDTIRRGPELTPRYAARPPIRPTVSSVAPPSTPINQPATVRVPLRTTIRVVPPVVEPQPNSTPIVTHNRPDISTESTLPTVTLIQPAEPLVFVEPVLPNQLGSVEASPTPVSQVIETVDTQAESASNLTDHLASAEGKTQVSVFESSSFDSILESVTLMAEAHAQHAAVPSAQEVETDEPTAQIEEHEGEKEPALVAEVATETVIEVVTSATSEEPVAEVVEATPLVIEAAEPDSTVLQSVTPLVEMTEPASELEAVVEPVDSVEVTLAEIMAEPDPEPEPALNQPALVVAVEASNWLEEVDEETLDSSVDPYVAASPRIEERPIAAEAVPEEASRPESVWRTASLSQAPATLGFISHRRAEPTTAPHAAPAASPKPRRGELPSARDILAAQGVRNRQAEAVAEAANAVKRSTLPVPTDIHAPEQWSLPLWLGWLPTTAFVLMLGVASMGLAFGWLNDSMTAAFAIKDVLRPDLPNSSALMAPIIAPGNWVTSTAQHQAMWAVALERSNDGRERRDDIRSLLESARRISPLAARSQFSLEPPAQSSNTPPSDPEDLSDIGRTRDIVSLVITGRRLHALGKVESSVKVYRQALELALKAEWQGLEPPRFDDDPQVLRYLLPREKLASFVVKDIVARGNWTEEQWSTMLPSSAMAAWVAAKQFIKLDRKADADRLINLATRLGETSAGEGLDESEHRAALAEALATRSQWTDAVEAYRRAIDLCSNDRTRRAWWLNLAELARRMGDDSMRQRAIDAAKASDRIDEITQRARKTQEMLDGGPAAQTSSGRR